MKKRLLATLLALVLLVGLLGGTASATFEECADALYQLELFHGTNEGYQLEQPATRVQALIMLIRLMGLEDEALASHYEIPYTDVREWMRPYVGYAWHNGLTNGVTATTFQPNAACTARMYATFLLRALGYDDLTARDFTYSGALTFARTLGVVDDYALSGTTFRRDNLVALSYLALSAAPKDGKTDNLLQRLCDAGVVDGGAALPYLTIFAAYRECAAAAEALAARPAVELTTGASVTARQNDTVLATVEQKIVRQRLGIEGAAGTVYCLTTADTLTRGGSTETSEEARLYRNGTLYTLRDGVAAESAQTVSEDPIGISLTLPSLCAVTDVMTRVTGGRTLCTFRFSADYLERQSAALRQLAGGSAALSEVDYALCYVLDSSMALTMQLVDLTAVADYAGVACDVTVSGTTELTATGSAVQLAYEP